MDKIIIGRTAHASFPNEGIKKVPVKIDTGADTSSIWASDIYIDEEFKLHFVLFGIGSPHYSGVRHTTKHYSVRLVRSSNGNTQVRYNVKLWVVLEGCKVRASFTLADRSKNTYPVLVGCKLLNGKFVVDVAKGSRRADNLKVKSTTLNDELQKDPYAFFQKYHQDNLRGDIEL